jgi:hypothetical protein
MTIVRKGRKGKYLNSLEEYHIFLISKQGIHMSEFNIDNNPILELITKSLKAPQQTAT